MEGNTNFETKSEITSEEPKKIQKIKGKSQILEGCQLSQHNEQKSVKNRKAMGLLFLSMSFFPEDVLNLFIGI